jgi:hypothetical protein
MKIIAIVAGILALVWLLPWAHHAIPVEAWFHVPAEITIMLAALGAFGAAFRRHLF